MKLGFRMVLATSAVLAASALLAAPPAGRRSPIGTFPTVINHDLTRVQQGLAISPVPMNLAGKNRDLVGLGSYLVNAVGGCNDCHSCPSYAPGHSPYMGGDGAINATNFLAGGVPFGPFISRNITPDENGLPAGLTPQEFVMAIRTGHDPDNPGMVLQVMPWPIFRNMTDHDLGAIYAYLSAIPHAESGTECTMAGQ